MVQPSVGRIVHYFARPGDYQQAAIVTAVHSERMVNLCVFTRNGQPNPATSVQLLQDNDQPGLGEWCCWPPKV